jgi:hypothetical protein
MRSLAGAFVVALGLMVGAPAAQAQFGIVRNADPFADGWIAQSFADDARLTTDAYSNTGGDKHDPYPVAGTGTGVYELAGGHPYIGVTDFTMRRDDPNGPPTGGNPLTVRVDIPRGLVPNPGGHTRCTDTQLSTASCPLSSQIGTQQMVVYIEDLAPLVGDITLKVPLYNLTPLNNPADTPREEVPARFGFNPAEVGEAILPGDAILLAPLLEALAGLHPVHIVGGVRDEPSTFGPNDFGLFFTIDHLPEYDPDDGASPGVVRSNLTFWGLPGDQTAHNGEYGQSCATFEMLLPPACNVAPPVGDPPDPDVPFLTTPTHCTGTSLSTRLSLWSHSVPPLTDTILEPTPTVVDVEDGIAKQGAQGCDENVPFDGDLAVDPQVTTPDSPSGASVSILIPQPGLSDKDLFATSHVKDVSVTMPPGMTLNPSAANGLQACTDAQLAADPGQPGGETCPDASRVGTVSAESPLLPAADENGAGTTDVLTGSAYVGQPVAGNKYRLFVTLEGRRISIRLKGSVKPNPSTGQLTATFANNPQLPFEDLTVDLRDGPRAPLATPLDCGPKVASAILSPWSGTPAIPAASAPFSIAGAGCPPGFAPTFGAATNSTQAGALTPFRATLARGDRNQFLSRARVVTPPGLAGMVSKATQCESAQATTGACPASSRIGTAITRAGSGSEPFQLSGPVYLTEGYKGGQFGMVVVIRAVAGPYDLGTVVVRQSIFVDPEDAHLTVVSDPFPTILDGVPIRLRLAEVRLDKPGFTYNPTSCGVKQVRSTLYPVQGTAVDRVANLNFTNCERLDFAPRMAMQLVGPRQTRFEGHPSLRTTVTARSGHANIGRVRVALPKALALDPDNSQKVCSVADAAKAQCPESTRIGFGKAISPALNRPLAGPAYFVQGIRTDPTTGAQIRTLPSLLVKLRGEIAINLRGTTDVEGNNLVSVFDRVPDAPVSDFRLNLRGGKRGPLVISARRGICDRRQITNTQYTGHNGKAAAQRVNMRKPCRRPLVVFRKIQPSTSVLVVRGTIRPKATKRLRVSLRCGKTRIAKTANRPRRGRWATRIKRKGACATSRKAKLRVSYPGGGDFRIAIRKRNVKLPPAGS